MLVEEDLQTQFFVAVEQIPQIEVTDLLKGLFVLFALHYIFYLEYNPRLKDFYLFVEDKLLCLPSHYSSVTDLHIEDIEYRLTLIKTDICLLY